MSEPAHTPAQSDNEAASKDGGGSRARWLNFASWGVSAAALAYVLSRLRLSEFGKDVSGINWWLVVLAVFIEIVPRLLEAGRWQYLLRPLHMRFGRLLQAIYVGTLYSGVLPLPVGDAVRGLMVARRAGISLIRVFSTELIERVADAIALILVVSFTLRGLNIPFALRIALAVLEVGVGLAIVTGLVMAAQHVSLQDHLQAWKPSGRSTRGMRSVGLDLIETLGRVRVQAMLVVIAAALAAAALNITAYWLILRAYHINLSPLHAAALFAIVMIGTILPGTPGNIGSWPFFCVLGLQLFGVSAARAAGFSLIAYVIWTVPPVLMGFGTLLTSSFRWSDLRTGRRELAVLRDEAVRGEGNGPADA